MVQQLLLKNQFIDILKNYRPSQAAQDTLRAVPVVLLNGPTASGRNTIIEKLVATGRYQQMVSDTTRSPRLNNGVLESSGREYWFKSEEEVLKSLKAGEYIEAAVIHDQQVSGVAVAELERALKTQKIAITDIQPDGVETFRKYKSDTISIFVIPPDFETWQSRLLQRGRMLAVELNRRFQSAQDELAHALSADYYHFVVNENLEQAVKDIDLISNAQAERVDNEAGRSLAQQLRKDIAEHLSSSSL